MNFLWIAKMLPTFWNETSEQSEGSVPSTGGQVQDVYNVKPTQATIWSIKLKCYK